MSKAEQALALYIAIAELDLNEDEHREAETLADENDPAYILPTYNKRPRRKEPPG